MRTPLSIGRVCREGGESARDTRNSDTHEHTGARPSQHSNCISFTRLRRAWWTLVVITGLLAVVTARGLAGDDAAPPRPWSPEDVAARFKDPDAGVALRTDVARCTSCHEDRRKSLGTSFHAELLERPEGCEACHGDGTAHSATKGEDTIRHPWDVPPVEIDGVCLRCHADVVTQPVRGHRRWLQLDATDASKVRACTHCHEIHVDRTARQFAADTGPFRDVAALDAVAESIPASRCIECHPDFHPAMRRSGHADLITEGARCQTCHGNGGLHERSGGRRRLIVNPEDQTPRAASKTCLSCHADGATVERWTCAEHAREGITCIICHDANGRRGKTLRASEFALCGGCHLDVKAKVRLPNRHDVAGGRVLCSDCHDPHANRSRVRDSDVRRRACEACHAEKAGPFLHDHGIKRTEGCVACHDPHGSVNDRVLSFARIKPFCLQCHPETAHDLASRRYDNCLACHTEIHGSDVDRLLRR